MRRRRKIRGGFQYFIYVAIFFVVVLISFVLGRVSADSAANSIDVENRSLGIPEDGVALWPGGTGKAPLLTLVNAESPLPSDWQCELVSLINGQSVDSRAYEDLQEMMDDARAEGLEPYICSSWRSHETQEELFSEEVEKYISQGYSEAEAEIQAAQWVALPGTSEHELGLALDIVSLENQRLEEAQEDTPTGQWLMAHCYEYGFILRYPKDKEDVTGIRYEPWHYRYVGRESAMAMWARDLCLEEYVTQK